MAGRSFDPGGTRRGRFRGRRRRGAAAPADDHAPFAEPIERAEPYRAEGEGPEDWWAPVGASPGEHQVAGRRGGAPVRSSVTGDDDGGPPTQAVSPVAGNGAPKESAAPAGTGAPTGPPAATGAATAATSPRERGRLRHRVLPRTLLGISCMILAFAVGAGFSGAVLFSYYQYRENQTNDRVNALISGYKKQFDKAQSDLQAAASNARAQIEATVNASHETQADPAAQQALVHRLGRSLFFVTTENASGQTSVGSAFVVASNSSDSLLLTSYTTVEAATTVPGPTVYVRQGISGAQTKVSVRTWDPAHDLALIVFPKGGLTPLQPAPSSPGPQLGQTVFALAGEGGAGASIAAGEVDDVSSAGIADDIPIGVAFQGGPVVTTSGQVVAVTSRTYAPLGFSSQDVWYAPFVDAACQRVLSCPGGSLSASS